MFEPRICESKGLRHSGFFDSDVFDSEMGKATGEHKKLGRGGVGGGGGVPGCPSELLGGPAT